MIPPTNKQMTPVFSNPLLLASCNDSSAPLAARCTGAPYCGITSQLPTPYDFASKLLSIVMDSVPFLLPLVEYTQPMLQIFFLSFQDRRYIAWPLWGCIS
jgi:hypothetical protein